VCPEVRWLVANVERSRRAQSLATMAANALSVVVHDFLPGIIPVMSLVRTLTNADFAIDTKVFVSINAKLMVVFIDWLEKQGVYPLRLLPKKSSFGQNNLSGASKFSQFGK